MGLDMYVFKMKRYGNATLRDATAVNSFLELQEYKKEHPDYKGSMKDWCGRDYLPAQDVIDFYTKCSKTNDRGWIETYEGVAYWRKANAIHKWFVKNIQDGEDDCEPHRELTKADLEELIDTAHEVLCDPDKAEALLPTGSGFFFGSTQYDSWYFDDLKSTIEQLRKVVDETDFETEALYYVSSW